MGVLYTNYNFVQEIGMDMPSLPLGIGFEFRNQAIQGINQSSLKPHKKAGLVRVLRYFPWSTWSLRAITSVRANFLSILQEKPYFFLFYTSTFTIHPHQFIYSTHLFNKIFLLFTFLLFPSLSSLEPSHRPNTNPKSPIPSFRLLHQATVFSVELQTQHKPKITHTQPTNHHQQLNRTKSPGQPPSSQRGTRSLIADSWRRLSTWIPTPSRPWISTRIDAEQNHPHPVANCSRPINSLSHMSLSDQFSVTRIDVPNSLTNWTQSVAREIFAELSSSSSSKLEISKKKEKLIGFAKLRWEKEKVVMKWERKSWDESQT